MTATDMSFQWFISRSGHTHGPVSSIGLALLAKLAHLQPSDYIWCNGLPDWVQAGSVAGLLSAPLPPEPPLAGLSAALDRHHHATGQGPARVFSARDTPDTDDGDWLSSLDRSPPIESRHAPPPGAAPEQPHVPHLARSLTRAAEGSAQATWRAILADPHRLDAPPRGGVAHHAATAGWPAGAADPVIGPATAGALTQLPAAIAPSDVPTAAHGPDAAGASGLIDWVAGSVSGLSVTGMIGAIRSGVEHIAAMAPAQIQGAIAQLHAFSWDNLIDAIASAFERMEIHTIDDLMDDGRMCDTAHVVLDKLPLTAKLCISLTVGEKGFEGFVLLIRDWLRQQIREEYRAQNVSPLIRQLLHSDNLKRQFFELFGDLKSRLMAPLAGRQPVPALALAAPAPQPYAYALPPPAVTYHRMQA